MKISATYRYMLFALSGLIILMSSCNSLEKEEYRHPADFDTNESVNFIWTTNCNGIVPQLTGIISSKDKVGLYVEKGENIKNIKAILKKFRSNLDNVEFIELEKKPKNVWLRDYGPAWLKSSQGKSYIVDFNYFGKKNTFLDQISEKTNSSLIPCKLSSTGGSREVNGKGTIILCEAHELRENSNLSRSEIESEIMNALNLKKVIWLNKGIPQDDSEMDGPLYDNIFPGGVNGHVDEFCRFANDTTIMLSYVSEKEAQSHPVLAIAKKRLDENLGILKNSTDQNGNKFNIVLVPYAPLQITEKGNPKQPKLITSVTSYMNFIITNSFVLVPSYAENASDEILSKENKVYEIFRKTFPSKKIVKVQSAELNKFGGGLHCISLNNHNPN